VTNSPPVLGLAPKIGLFRTLRFRRVKKPAVYLPIFFFGVSAPLFSPPSEILALYPRLLPPRPDTPSPCGLVRLLPFGSTDPQMETRAIPVDSVKKGSCFFFERNKNPPSTFLAHSTVGPLSFPGDTVFFMDTMPYLHILRSLLLPSLLPVLLTTFFNSGPQPTLLFDLFIFPWIFQSLF